MKVIPYFEQSLRYLEKLVEKITIEESYYKIKNGYELNEEINSPSANLMYIINAAKCRI
jgi:hypothetical protein